MQRIVLHLVGVYDPFDGSRTCDGPLPGVQHDRGEEEHGAAPVVALDRIVRVRLLFVRCQHQIHYGSSR